MEIHLLISVIGGLIVVLRNSFANSKAVTSTL